MPQEISELMSNSWDADSHKVNIQINYNEKYIIVEDDGISMTSTELNDNFLTITKNRRLSDQNDGVQFGLSKGERKVTGKKGLGKLALFGIANSIIVESVKDNKRNAFSINYLDIQNNKENIYHPTTLVFDEQTSKTSGTKITIKDITAKNITDFNTLVTSLSKRFKKYSRDDFLVTLTSDNGDFAELDESAFDVSIRPKSEDLEFTFRFPEDFKSGQSQNSIKIIEKLNKLNITGVIYMKKTPFQASKNGFSVLSRGKLASEQTVTQFNNRANDLFYSYAVGYFNIDYIDKDNNKDFISTDRHSIRWDSDEELWEIRTNLNSLLNTVQKIWRLKRKDQQNKKAKQAQSKSSIISKTNLSQQDKKTIDNISNLLFNEKTEVPENIKIHILDEVSKATISYKKDNSVYKELIPSNFFVPHSAGTKIRMLREEIIEAAEDKDIHRFILTQGLLLRAMIESTTTTLIKKYWEEASNSDLINVNGTIKHLNNYNEVDQLPFGVKYGVMIKLLVRHGKIAKVREDSLITEFANNKVTKHLNTLMHDANNFPQFNTLKLIWNCISPQLLLAFDIL
ncbi:hypothetical protein A9Y58_00003 [Streptococcus parauberis]|uniref:ATP-binding protein n=1 Tax=Streptococcus parauberis TaxID=1348 RepID=UPI0009C945B4|nr:ATP-binding protein [Streptococcus parauberis]ONH64618.1 hypothetical protein ASN87_00053 [Streptococcus parauberis]PCH14587.1 hypothetical protein A9Y58_00003 [Streptococcus parauberis]